MIWNEFIECMDRERLVKLQSERLSAMIEKLYYNVPFYRKKFQKSGIEPGDVKYVDQLKNLPFTTKQDLRDNYPFGLLLCRHRKSCAYMPRAAQQGSRQL